MEGLFLTRGIKNPAYRPGHCICAEEEITCGDLLKGAYKESLPFATLPAFLFSPRPRTSSLPLRK